MNIQIYALSILYTKTNFPAFSTPSLFLSLECTRLNVEKTLSMLADEHTAVIIPSIRSKMPEFIYAFLDL